MGQRMTHKQALARSHQGAKYLYTPQRLSDILRYTAAMPVLAAVCRKVGISRSTIDHWIKRSAAGSPGDGFDVSIDGEAVRFHVAFESALQTGIDKVEQKAMEVAAGEAREVLTHHGRVMYKSDPELAQLLGLPLDDPRCYLRDEHDNPIPETVPLFDPDMARFILKARRPDTYGDRSKLDVSVRGGVLVVGAKLTPEQLEKNFGGEQTLPQITVTMEETDPTP